MSNNNFSIGIFDSGVGGLTVVKETIKRLPNENIIYLGDTARLPYGTKSKNTVIKYAESNTEFLLSKGVKLLVVACNTASSHSLNKLKKNYKIPIIGVIEPGANKAVQSTKNGKVGIIATPSTIRSGAYQKAIKKINPKIKTYSKACPLFVPLVEEGWQNGDIAQDIAKKYLGEFKKKKIDVLILGCTHYPLLKNTIKKVLGDKIRLIDSAEETARDIAKEMSANIGNKRVGKKEFYLTDNSENFLNIASKFLGRKISKIKVIDIV